MTAMPILPNDPSDAKPCRSRSPQPAGDQPTAMCDKPRGHKSGWHRSPAVRRRWRGGINTPAQWEPPADDGYRSEGEYEAMRRSGVRW